MSVPNAAARHRMSNPYAHAAWFGIKWAMFFVGTAYTAAALWAAVS